MRTPLQSIYERIKISPVSSGKRKLNQDFIYYSTIKGSNDFITVPKGFIFDGASLPRLFWIYGTPMGIDTLPGAIIHDFLYRTQKTTRQYADNKFNEVMIICKVRTFKRILYFLGVRVGGRKAWRENKEKAFAFTE